MSEPIIYVDQSEIRDGKLEELKEGLNDLAEFIEANEPQLLAYNVYFNEDRTRMTVFHVHPDSSSLERHMEVAGELFPKFSEFIQLECIDIYGAPTDDVVERLQGKADMLGSGAVHVHDIHAGMARFSAV